MFHVKRALAWLAAFLLLAGCTPAPTQSAPTVERTFFAMDTVMTLRLYEGGDEALLIQAGDRVKELETLWSVTDENSEIYTLNHSSKAELSLETAQLLRAALDMCERTDGALDISSYPVVRAWGFTTGEYAVPGEETIATLLPLVDYTRVELDGTSASLPQGMEIDLGSVAKGYTGGVLATCLKENGVTSAMLDLGATSRPSGPRRTAPPGASAFGTQRGTETWAWSR